MPALFKTELSAGCFSEPQLQSGRDSRERCHLSAVEQKQSCCLFAEKHTQNLSRCHQCQVTVKVSFV